MKMKYRIYNVALPPIKGGFFFEAKSKENAIKKMKKLINKTGGDWVFAKMR